MTKNAKEIELYPKQTKNLNLNFYPPVQMKAAYSTGCPGANIYVSTCSERQKYASQIWFEGVVGILNSGNLTYDPWIWLKVTYMASTASNRKSAKNQ